jgi:hypothetical protein
MLETLGKRWWLLALVGVLEALIAAIFLVMLRTNGPLTFHASNRSIVFLGGLALLAGAGAIAAGIWKAWPLVLNGLALGSLGFIYYALTRFPIRFLTIALLVIVMAASLAVLELRTRMNLAAAVAVGFALAFSAMGFGWIKFAPGSNSDRLWLCCFFCFSAICMLVLAVRLRHRRSAGDLLASA